MKCKPNQLVRYVGNNPVKRENIFGWVGTTVSYCFDDFQELCWVVTPPLSGGNRYVNGKRYVANLVKDKNLQPIENPGEDAVDQMVFLVGKPKTEDKILTV